MDAATIAAIRSRGDCYSFHSPFPVLCVHRDGLLVYANEASSALLDHWGCRPGDRLPAQWREIVSHVFEDSERVDVEVRAGERLLVLTFVPVHVQDCVQIYGYDATTQTHALQKLARSEEEYRIAREALFESEERLRSLQDNLPLGVYRSTPDGRILHANETLARMFGCESVEEICSRRTIDFYVDPSQREQFLRVLEQHGMVKDWELTLKRTDGTVTECALNVRAVFDDDGTVRFHDGIIADISDRKRIQEATLRAKQEAEVASRIKSNFIATMSHELRTPLNGILGFASLLEEELSTNEELREMAGIIHSSGLRLLETLNSILDLSIVEAGKLAVHAETVDVHAVVEEVALLYSASAQKKGLQLRITPVGGRVTATTDERLLRQILNNLLNNAVKYTDAGNITLEIEHSGESAAGTLRIHVDDTGIGIAPSHHGVIFDEFRQASEGYSRAYDGSGLGLSVCQKFAHVLGGRITFVSEPGAGSRFTLHLPA